MCTCTGSKNKQHFSQPKASLLFTDSVMLSSSQGANRSERNRIMTFGAVSCRQWRVQMAWFFKFQTKPQMLWVDFWRFVYPKESSYVAMWFPEQVSELLARYSFSIRTWVPIVCHTLCWGYVKRASMAPVSLGLQHSRIGGWGTNTKIIKTETLLHLNLEIFYFYFIYFFFFSILSLSL
jgi:hypothetical protein